MEATNLASCQLALTITDGVIGTDTVLTLGTGTGRLTECYVGMRKTATGLTTSTVVLNFSDLLLIKVKLEIWVICLS